jgi:tetratricopeptide (TPR) repeat protein
MNRLAYAVFGTFLLAGVQPLCAQQINPRVPPPPPPGASSDAPTSAASGPASSAPAAHPAAGAAPIDPTVPPPPPPADEPAEAAAPSTPVFDPLHAQRSLDVGNFYLKKGNYDAAIDRFVDASNYQPGLAAPWKMLGETYEKKHEYAKAAESYNKYLQILPHAADAAKIKKIISELKEKSAQESPKKAER